MTYTITRDDGAKDARFLRDALDVLTQVGGGVNEEARSRLYSLANSIEEQVKPAITEPKEFGSIVRAVCLGGTDPQLWQRSYGDGKHYWESENGVVDVWSDLTDVEVLRVGLGEPKSDHPDAIEVYVKGKQDMNTWIHDRLLKMLDTAISSERKNALEKAIQAVEEMAP